MILTAIIALFLQLLPQDSSFRNAVQDKSTNPYFILITVINDTSNTQEVFATEAPFLLGAIHIEHSIPYTEAGSVTAQNIVLSNTDHLFHFKRKAALKNLGRFYNEQILSDVKKRLDSLSNGELLKQLRNPKSDLHKIYQGRVKGTHIPYRNAVAQVLLEKGIPVRRDGKSGYLFSN